MSDSTSVPDIPRLFRPEDEDLLEATIEVAAGTKSVDHFVEAMDMLGLERDRVTLTAVRREVGRRTRRSA